MVEMAVGAIKGSVDAGLPPGRASVVMVFPKGFKRPPGFPKTVLACERPDGAKVVYANAMAVLRYIVRGLDDAFDVSVANPPAGVSK